MKRVDYRGIAKIIPFFCIFACACKPQPPGASPKLVMIGYDSANWRIIDYLQERGDMPVIKSLRETGSWGKMQSLEDLISALAAAASLG